MALKLDRSITSEGVIDTLAEVFVMYGIQRYIRSDNGPEFMAKSLRGWLKRVGVGTLYAEPGSTCENGYAESFISRLREEFLAVEEFGSLSAARSLTHRWRQGYNQVQPRRSLGYFSQAVFSARWITSIPEQAWATPQPATALQQPTADDPTRPTEKLVQKFMTG